MNDQTPTEPDDGLWSRLRLIEGQPLDARAVAYSALHEDLSRKLESVPRTDSTRAHMRPAVSDG